MTTNQPFFLTSAIPYVNAEPHLGHALELVQGDALARALRGAGRDLRFTSGTDDNSLKNVRAASERGTTPSELVARYGAEFRRLAEALHVSHDDFIHTASDPRHVPAVHALWQRCVDAGDVYRKAYRGLYCVGCEQFLRDSELVDGGCAVHLEPLELLEEENWFFRLSRYQGALLDALESGRLRIEPEERKNEVCRFVRAGLEDFSISRSRARAKSWGVPVPGDDSQIVYVWFDALANYLAVLGYPNDPAFARYWQGEGERQHLIGKDIVRFHAVYWPAILLSAGLPLPTTVLVHGFITVNGRKLGKSTGNGVDPRRLIAKYGVDAVRYYLLAHLHCTKDSDFREELLENAYRAELAGKLGNLLQRVCALCDKHAPTAQPAEHSELREVAEHARAAVDRALRDFALQDALRVIFELVAAANRYVDSRAPWQLAKQGARHELDCCLSSLVRALHAIAELLAPFLPSTAQQIRERLEPTPHGGPPLFPPR